MDFSKKECPQCGYDYMDFYESLAAIRYICPHCGYTEEVEKEKRDRGLMRKKRSDQVG